jgi:hypothetical protein
MLYLTLQAEGGIRLFIILQRKMLRGVNNGNTLGRLSFEWEYLD